MINVVVIDGRLVNAAVYKSNGQADIATFTIAHNEVYKTEKQAYFIECVAFGNQALFLKKSGVKGTKLTVQGKLKQDTFTKRDGTKQSKFVIICNLVDLASENNDKEKIVVDFEPQTKEEQKLVEDDDDLPF